MTNMNNTNLEETLLKLIDDYIDNDTHIYEIQKISECMNKQFIISTQIRSKFYSLLSETDPTKTKKTLDLLEYLTVFSSSQVAELINENQFMDCISQILIEDYFQDQVLNLLRLWADDYQERELELPQLFSFIENLEAFGICLPTFYHSQYRLTSLGQGIDDNKVLEDIPLLSKEKKSRDTLEDVVQILDQEGFDFLSKEGPSSRKGSIVDLLDHDFEPSHEMPLFTINHAEKQLIDQHFTQSFDTKFANSLLMQKGQILIPETDYQHKIQLEGNILTKEYEIENARYLDAGSRADIEGLGTFIDWKDIELRELEEFNKHHENQNVVNSDQNLKSQEKVLEESKCTFHSKLMVRRKYHDPDLLTKFFHKSSVFNGIPFISFDIEAHNKGNKDENEGSLKVLENQKTE